MPLSFCRTAARRPLRLAGATLALAVIVPTASATGSPATGSPATGSPATGSSAPAGARAPSPVEEHYRAAGSWAVTTTDVPGAGGLTYRISHPRDLGAHGFSHPILVWGNGTGSTAAQYSAVFRRLASWGFVVIGSSDRQQADGRTMLAALRYLFAANLDPAGTFFGVLDPTEVGVFGHSQGAGGAVNAANHAGQLVDTVVPINLPDLRYVPKGFSVADLPTPTLFLGGGTDGLISSPGGLRHYYAQSPRAALGILRGADHLAIRRSGNGYLGYLTAWMMWHLQDDPYAGSAFVGRNRKDTEFRRNARWQDQQAKGLG